MSEFDIMQGYHLDTYRDYVYLVCDRCNQEWTHRVDDGEAAGELFIAAVSHWDENHKSERED